MKPPGNQNPASSLPQQDKRWTVEKDVDGEWWLVCNGRSLAWCDTQLNGQTIVDAHMATLSEPKPEAEDLQQAADTLRRWARDRQAGCGRWTLQEQKAVECAARLEATLAEPDAHKVSTQEEKPRLGNHDCEYDKDDAPCNHCGKTASEAIHYFEHVWKPKQDSGIPDASKAGVEEQSFGITDAPADNAQAVLQNARCLWRYCGAEKIRLLFHCTSCDKTWPVPGGGLNRKAIPSSQGGGEQATGALSDEKIAKTLAIKLFKDGRGWPIDEVTLTKDIFQRWLLTAIRKAKSLSEPKEQIRTLQDEILRLRTDLHLLQRETQAATPVADQRPFTPAGDKFSEPKELEEENKRLGELGGV